MGPVRGPVRGRGRGSGRGRGRGRVHRVGGGAPRACAPLTRSCWSLQRKAEDLGYEVFELARSLEGDARAEARSLVAELERLGSVTRGAVCLLAGGETTCILGLGLIVTISPALLGAALHHARCMRMIFLVSNSLLRADWYLQSNSNWIDIIRHRQGQGQGWAEPGTGARRGARDAREGNERPSCATQRRY